MLGYRITINNVASAKLTVTYCAICCVIPEFPTFNHIDDVGRVMRPQRRTTASKPAASRRTAPVTTHDHRPGRQPCRQRPWSVARADGPLREQLRLGGRERNRLRPTPGARELVRAVDERGLRVVLASSASRPELEAMLRTLDADAPASARAAWPEWPESPARAGLSGRSARGQRR